MPITGAPTTAHVPHKQWSQYEEIQNYATIERWGSLLGTKAFPVHDQLIIPHKLWADPFEHQNYLEMERWAARIQQGKFQPLHFPHKTWAFPDYDNAQMELDNYRYLESWSLGWKNYGAEAPPTPKPPGGVLRHHYVSGDPQIFAGTTTWDDEKLIVCQGAGGGPGGQNVLQLSTDHNLNSWTTIFTGTGSTGGGSSKQIMELARDDTYGYYCLADSTNPSTTTYNYNRVRLDGTTVTPTHLFTLNGPQTFPPGPTSYIGLLIHPISGNFIIQQHVNDTSISEFRDYILEVTPGGSVTTIYTFAPRHTEIILSQVQKEGSIWLQDQGGSPQGLNTTFYRLDWFTRVFSSTTPSPPGPDLYPEQSQMIPTFTNTILFYDNNNTYGAGFTHRAELFYSGTSITPTAASYVNYFPASFWTSSSPDKTVVYYASTQGTVTGDIYTIWEMT